MITINGRTAFQREDRTIMWYPKMDAYVVLDELAKVVFSNPILDTCFKIVRQSIN